MNKFFATVYLILFYLIFILVKVCSAYFSFIKPRKKNHTVLYLELFNHPSAGYRFRSHAWAEIVAKYDYEVSIKSLIDFDFFKSSQKSSYSKFIFHTTVLYKRFFQCLASSGYDVVIVRRELLLYNDYGNLFFEKWMKQMHPKMILDVDDDVSVAKKEPRKIFLYGRIMKENSEKFKDTLSYYQTIICGSEYLKQRMLMYNASLSPDRVIIIPSCINYKKYEPKNYSTSDGIIHIGWASTSYNYNNLKMIIPALEKLSHEFPIQLLIICDENIEIPLSINTQYIKWNELEEIKNLLKIDIGIMPLIDNDENKGKCSLKLVQYMGLGIVSIASALTLNYDIIEEGVNGFLATDEEWYEVLKKVIAAQPNFKNISENARKKILFFYSYEAHEKTYLSIIE